MPGITFSVTFVDVCLFVCKHRGGRGCNRNPLHILGGGCERDARFNYPRGEDSDSADGTR